MNNLYIKTVLVLAFSFGLTFSLTQLVFYPENQELRPQFIKLLNRVTNPVIGGSGDPIQPGIDPTPPPGLY